ncbi:MAG: YdcF family protein [Bacteroidaceae bacterium]|nr:YdcF family protein [Bacteroidaceae bacterium]
MIYYLTNPIFYVFLFMMLELLTWWKRMRRLRYVSLIISAILLLVFTNPRLYVMAERAWIGDHDKTDITGKHYRYGLVLGGYSYWDWKRNRPEFSEIADRLFEAIQLYHHGVIDKVVLASDGSVIDENISPGLHGNADEMRKYVVRLGVKDEDLIIEPKANNTHENATFTIDLLGDSIRQQRPLVITSAIHMRRSLLAFNQAGLEVDTYATDIDAPFLANGGYKFLQPGVIGRWTALIHEVAGYIAYKHRYSPTKE